MHAVIGALFVALAGLFILMIFGPIVATLVALAMTIVLAVVALPVLIILSPWLLIGFIVWLLV